VTNQLDARKMTMKRTKINVCNAMYNVLPIKGVDDIDIVNIPVEGMGTIEEVLFVGAGTSTSVPNVACLAAKEAECMVCLDAVGRIQRSEEYTRRNGGPPTDHPSRNLRTNPSAAIRYRHSDGTLHTVLIDCGKTFYSNALKQLLKAGVGQLDGVLLTHGHADALLGLDDLRHWAGHWPSIQPHVDVHCDEDTMAVVKAAFPYIVDPACATGGGEVSALQFHLFNTGRQLMIGELPVLPVRVLHGTHSDGRPYYASGFRIHGITYLSDISGIPEEAIPLLKSPPTTLLVADCLFERNAYKSHYCWPQTKVLIEMIKPKCTVLVGMAHTIDYYSFQQRVDDEFDIKKSDDGVIGKMRYEDGRVLVGFDGMLLRPLSGI
jgi:phosphoribosyl 1,2-cyclic phosphodiesterase